MPVRFPFDNTYARLPERVHARLDPALLAASRLVRVNVELAERLGLDPLDVLSRPFEDRPGFERHAAPPEPGERVHQTFCGT